MLIEDFIEFTKESVNAVIKASIDIINFTIKKPYIAIPIIILCIIFPKIPLFIIVMFICIFAWIICIYLFFGFIVLLLYIIYFPFYLYDNHKYNKQYDKQNNNNQLKHQIIDNSKQDIQYQQTEQIIDKQTIDDHFNAIYNIHPDADEIAKSEELQQWINLFPEYDRVNVQNIIKQGTAEEVIQMLNSFKKWKNNKKNRLNISFIKATLEEIEEHNRYLDTMISGDGELCIFRDDTAQSEQLTEEELQEELQQKLDEHLYCLPDNVSIGRAYERYIGYLYEQDNWQVLFNGCIMGVDDNGIDLICQKDNEIHIIQAKNWANKIYNKTVHQLYGSMADYKLSENHQDKHISGVIFTTNGADYRAIQTAKRLNIEIRIIKLDKTYPLIKCKKDDNTYYLPPEIEYNPINQYYDNLSIIISQGDMYCKTIQQAKQLGFTQLF